MMIGIHLNQPTFIILILIPNLFDFTKQIQRVANQGLNILYAFILFSI
jgi:hypothetical protein